MENSGIDKDNLLKVTTKLIDLIEKGDDNAVEKTLDEVVSIRESSLFQEIGKLTRELHDSIRNFELDDRFNDITETEIPDAKERLEYVLTMTEQSADKTLTAVEASQPKLDDLSARVSDIGDRWERFLKKDLNADEFRKLAGDIGEFLADSKTVNGEINSHLNTVLMAQDFQDLTGQIIRRVINLVEDVESNLVNLIRLQGDTEAKDTSAKEKTTEAKTGRDALEGPQVPGKESADVMNNQDDVDDLLASLGF